MRAKKLEKPMQNLGILYVIPIRIAQHNVQQIVQKKLGGMEEILNLSLIG